MVFGDIHEKELPIPEHIEGYNYKIGAIDRGNQLKAYNPGLRPIYRGGWQALFHWLINIVLVNSYLLSFHLKVNKNLKFNDQVKFREAIIDTLFKEAGPG